MQKKVYEAMPACDGGPAFPLKEPVSSDATGMSLRDYFAARAPANIPSWFEYEPPMERPIIPDFRNELPRKLHNDWNGLGDWLDDHEVDPAVLAFRDRYESAQEAYDQWLYAMETGRYFAWRWYYADAMLRARESAPAADRVREAAPELLEACIAVDEWLMQGFADSDVDNPAYNEAFRRALRTVRAAIAKATSRKD